jgi:hypothetical protein
MIGSDKSRDGDRLRSGAVSPLGDHEADRFGEVPREAVRISERRGREFGGQPFAQGFQP